MPNRRPHRRTDRPKGPPLGNSRALRHGLKSAVFVEHRRAVTKAIREANRLARGVN
jgi:hypothetical protein